VLKSIHQSQIQQKAPTVPNSVKSQSAFIMETALDLFAMAQALADENDGDARGDVKGQHDVQRDLSELWKLDDRLSTSINRLRHHHQDEVKELAVDEPCVISGCSDEWEARNWTFENLEERFGEENFALYNGQQFSFHDYFRYARNRAERDHSPLYLFEDLSLVKASSPKLALLDEYSVPQMFQGCDLFDIPGAEDFEDRPRFRWLLIGPARSGTKIHVDPFGTSAWNTLLKGHKRWVVIPPQSGFNPENFPKEKNLLHWFTETLPQIRQEITGVIEFIQFPGETVFIPFGWWHVVINLDLTLAVTQNFASKHNFSKVVQEMEHPRWKGKPFQKAWFHHLTTQGSPGLPEVKFHSPKQNAAAAVQKR